MPAVDSEHTSIYADFETADRLSDVSRRLVGANTKVDALRALVDDIEGE